VTGAVISVGGLGTTLDNLSLFSQMNAAILANPLLTPPTNSQQSPIVSLTVTVDGLPNQVGLTSLSSGTPGTQPTTVTLNGGGNVGVGKAAIDTLLSTPFDIGTLAGIYDPVTQAYADGQAQGLEPYGYLQRWIHQVTVTISSANILVNSTSASAQLVAAAATFNSKRSSVVGQQITVLNFDTGLYETQDAAPYLCGMAALLGATGTWGPATPLTYEHIPGAVDVTVPILRNTNDTGAAILGGAIVLERIGPKAPGAVRIVQSVTTQPNDPNTGVLWPYAEFSVVRASDALLANIKATVETSRPKALGGGNTVKTQNAILAEVKDILELAMDGQWVTFYDPASLAITPTQGIGDNDILSYAVSFTIPLNHLGIDQRIIPFQTPINPGSP
jgi:hypothetical protein